MGLSQHSKINSQKSNPHDTSNIFKMDTMNSMQILANILSTFTILSCLFLKVPQIMYIRKKQSAQGIYVQAMLMEITGFSIVTLYNYTNKYSPMTYMEYPIILLQIYVMLFYVLKYKGLLSKNYVSLYVMFYIGSIVSFACEILPKEWLSYMIPICTPLSGFAKVTYMYGIVQAGNSDAVSMTTWLISLGTNLARLFTVYVDSADTKLMYNFGISSMLSLGVLVTAWLYRRPAEPAEKPRRSIVRIPKEFRHLHND